MNRKTGRQAQARPAVGRSNETKRIFILSLALLLRGALSLLHGSGPSARRHSHLAGLKLRSSRSVANLIPPKVNTI
ncbi:MAG: hypothetical protein PWR16_94 [Methanoculleus sp.]|jgi:hypothetical protein|nr:hypothetical protein [Methanoculleus sp.]